MIIQDERREKMCCFYVSEFHLEMILVPYIDKKIEKQEKITILTQKNLKDSIEILIPKMNLKEEKKRKILELKWNGEEKIQNNSNIIVIGSKKFIEEKNQEIQKFNIKDIIDCYDFEEIKDDMNDITKGYNNQLNSLGNNKF